MTSERGTTRPLNLIPQHRTAEFFAYISCPLCNDPHDCRIEVKGKAWRDGPWVGVDDMEYVYIESDGNEIDVKMIDMLEVEQRARVDEKAHDALVEDA